MAKKQTKLVAGLEELRMAVQEIAAEATEGGHANMLLGILAGTIGWYVRDAEPAKDPLRHLARPPKEIAGQIRRAFGDVHKWGVHTPIGKALLKIYDYCEARR